MMKHVVSARGTVALMISHCAGMVDLVALPIWVSTLITYFKLDPQQAGAVVTLFLLGSVIASIFTARRITQIDRKKIAILGFFLASAFMLGAAFWHDFHFLLIWHLMAGLSVGAALSMTHGTIALSQNPHRLFALVGIALGIFAVVFLGVMPQVIAKASGDLLFIAFAVVMAVAMVVNLFAFPTLKQTASSQTKTSQTLDQPAAKMPTYIWMGMLGICCMGLVQSMTFSFLERIGDVRGFGFAAISGVLIAIGLVNLIPAPLAALFEKKLSVRIVLFVGPLAQVIVSFVITHTSFFPLYAFTASIFAAIMIFTHTFAFGYLSRLDKTGRAMAATPAILMTGAAIGPILGGTIVKNINYETIGYVACLIGVISIVCFSRVTQVQPEQNDIQPENKQSKHGTVSS